MTSWPPIKAWTSKKQIKGQYHFVVINYGIRAKKHLVNLVSVVDSKICFVLNFDELSNNLLWLPGWQEIENEKTKDGIFFTHENNLNDTTYEKGSLHPSDDSGLSIGGSDSDKLRPWFPN